MLRLLLGFVLGVEVWAVGMGMVCYGYSRHYHHLPDPWEGYPRAVVAAAPLAGFAVAVLYAGGAWLLSIFRRGHELLSQGRL